MKLDSKIKRELNKIVNKYNGWKTPREVSFLWDELSKKGIDIFIYGWPTHIAETGAKSWIVDFTCNDEPVENSKFVYNVYEGHSDNLKNEYNMYFS